METLRPYSHFPGCLAHDLAGSLQWPLGNVLSNSGRLPVQGIQALSFLTVETFLLDALSVDGAARSVLSSVMLWGEMLEEAGAHVNSVAPSSRAKGLTVKRAVLQPLVSDFSPKTFCHRKMTPVFQ